MGRHSSLGTINLEEGEKFNIGGIKASCSPSLYFLAMDGRNGGREGARWGEGIEGGPGINTLVHSGPVAIQVGRQRRAVGREQT